MWRLHAQHCIQCGSSGLSQCYTKNIGKNKSGQTISDSLMSDKGQQWMSRTWQKCNDISWTTISTSHSLFSGVFLDRNNASHFITFKGQRIFLKMDTSCNVLLLFMGTEQGHYLLSMLDS